MAKLNGVDDQYGSDNLPQVVNDKVEYDWEDAWEWDTQTLSNNLWAIQRKEASDLMDEFADPVNLDIPDSYVDSDELISVFNWGETKQGYGYWEEIYHELVSGGYEIYPDGYEHE